MDASRQREILAAILEAAREENVLVAPVGSVYFLVAGTPRAATKDVDIVVHGKNLQPPSMDVLRRVAARLARYGAPEATPDGAVLQVRSDATATAEIELIRGRSGAKGGFFPRNLLVKAASEARREGNLLIYPLSTSSSSKPTRPSTARREPSATRPAPTSTCAAPQRSKRTSSAKRAPPSPGQGSTRGA